mgnify:CR=1 FL=1
MAEDENIEQAGLTLTMRFKSLQTGKERLNVTYYDETAFRMSSFELIQGRLPEAETEIAIPSSYLEKKGISASTRRMVLAKHGKICGSYCFCHGDHRPAVHTQTCADCNVGFPGGSGQDNNGGCGKTW